MSFIVDSRVTTAPASLKSGFLTGGQSHRQRDSATARQRDSATARQRDSATAKLNSNKAKCQTGPDPPDSDTGA
jgi:hypothetical protein